MKRGSLLHSLGIWVSSFTSIFAAHTLMAKGDNIKELTKTSKKLRPSQSQSAGEDATPPTLEESLDQSNNSADRYPWKKDIVTTTFWIGEKPAPGNPVPNHKSSWDANWADNYGGTDTPDRNSRTTPDIEFTTNTWARGGIIWIADVLCQFPLAMRLSLLSIWSQFGSVQNVRRLLIPFVRDLVHGLNRHFVRHEATKYGVFLVEMRSISEHDRK